MKYWLARATYFDREPTYEVVYAETEVIALKDAMNLCLEAVYPPSRVSGVKVIPIDPEWFNAK